MKKVWHNVLGFFRKIRRVWDFLPYVWKGYDFDYGYAIELFKYQLERTANYLESDRSYGINASIRAKKIRTAITLMEKVYKEEYSMEWLYKIKEIYGPEVIDWQFEDTGKSDGSSYLRYEYEKWDNSSEIRAKINELIKASQEKEEKAERILWAYIQHNIKDWWD